MTSRPQVRFSSRPTGWRSLQHAEREAPGRGVGRERAACDSLAQAGIDPDAPHAAAAAAARLVPADHAVGAVSAAAGAAVATERVARHLATTRREVGARLAGLAGVAE